MPQVQLFMLRTTAMLVGIYCSLIRLSITCMHLLMSPGGIWCVLQLLLLWQLPVRVTEPLLLQLLMQLLADAKAAILLVLLVWLQLKVMAASLSPSSRILHHTGHGLSAYIMLRLMLVFSSSNSSCVRRLTVHKTCQAWFCIEGRRGSSC